MTNFYAIHTVRFIVLLLVQVLVLCQINFMGYINPYVYILFILLFPVKNNRPSFLIISFLLGLTVDIFLDSGGMHAAASVSIAFIRPAALKTSFGTVYEHQALKFNNIDLVQRITYITILVFIHHLILFSLDVFSLSKILLILKNTVLTSIFTIVLSVLITIIFSTPNKK